MLFEGKNQVVIYLEDWQMRMIKDFAPRRLPLVGGAIAPYRELAANSGW